MSTEPKAAKQLIWQNLIDASSSLSTSNSHFVIWTWLLWMNNALDCFDDWNYVFLL